MLTSEQTTQVMRSAPVVGATPASGSVFHTFFDDLQAAATAIVLVSLGVALLSSAGLLTGGAPGLGFLLSYATGWPLGVALVAVNLPFYVLGWQTLGARFTLKSLVSVVGLALGVELARHVLKLQAPTGYAAIAGGLLIGVGLLMMFRHRASFGGVNVLALYLHQRFGWSTGKVQFGIDAAILAAGFLAVDANRVIWSVLGAAALNAVLIWNHRPGRYVGA
jgi:uncharacterized membrane-anchored protein YitT (DUF2179 family)